MGVDEFGGGEGNKGRRLDHPLADSKVAEEGQMGARITSPMLINRQPSLIPTRPMYLLVH